MTMNTAISSFVASIVQKIVTISACGLPAPGHNDWSNEAVSQGFSWRRGNVTFEVLEDAGDVPFVVTMAPEVAVSPEAFRAIVVPFEVGEGGVEVADMYYGSKHVFDVPPGHYALLFEMSHREASAELESAEDEPVRCTLTFVPATTPVEARVLCKDDLLDPPDPLVLDGKPA
jgi:hypothetical protein